MARARVSAEDQELALQLDALAKAGCETVYQERLSAKALVVRGMSMSFHAQACADVECLNTVVRSPCSDYGVSGKSGPDASRR